MSINSQIVSALSGIGLPVAEGTYEGTENSYITFWCEAIPTDHADDLPQYDRWLVEVDLVTPHTVNTVSMCASIRLALSAAGFTFPSQQREHLKTNTGTMAVVIFECEKAEGVPE